MNRREFIRVAGAAAVYTFLPHAVFAEAEEGPVFAASAILQPSFAAPAIVKSGNLISSYIPAGLEAVKEIWLQPSGGKEEIKLKPGEPAKLAGHYSLPLEGKLEPGMYDLCAKVDQDGKTRVERQPLAVKVVGEFKEDFVFGIVSDVHFGDPRLASKIPGYDVGETFRKEINILNERGVEFCLCCGDLCFIPPKTKKEIMEYAETLMGNAKFPTFLVPGNHDGYASGTPAKVNFDTYNYYRRYFGPLSFESSYGDVSIIGVNTFDKSAELRNLYGGHGEDVDTGAISRSQLDWLDDTLRRARANSKSIVMFGHHNPTNTVKDVNGPFTIVPFSENGREEFLGLIRKYEPEAYFCGHVHGIHEEILGKTRILTAPTAASLPADGHPVGIQLVKVSGGGIDSVETIEILRV